MDKQAPGTKKLKHFQPKLRYELIGCDLHGHELVGLHGSGKVERRDNERDTGWEAIKRATLKRRPK